MFFFFVSLLKRVEGGVAMRKRREHYSLLQSGSFKIFYGFIQVFFLANNVLCISDTVIHF